MEEVKKSASQRVYKSASVRNLPVPVQSLLQCQSVMDPEDPPSETSAEKDYNSILLELAKRKTECDDQLGKLQQKADVLASLISGEVTGRGNSTSTPSPDGDSGVLIKNKIITSTLGNRSFAFEDTPVNKTEINGIHPSNSTSGEGGGNLTVGCPVCPDLPLPKECDPCKECPPCGTTPGSHDGTGSCSSPSGTSSFFSGLVDSPSSFAVGAAVVLLILAVVVLISLVIRYIPIILSGVFVLSLMCVVGYCSSKHPEATRRLVSRVWGAVSSATVFLVHRLLGRRNPEVSE
jgi:hypothetical protein